VVVQSPAPGSPAAIFSPPPHSIAVLPFLNMSGDKEQEYFSDGLTEELLNSLARINELQVAARTSSFSFKGKETDLGTIARKLNVGSVLEGSVRRSGNTIRVTAQLNNAITGFHLWSQTYDRDLSDILNLQTEIATAVAGALKVALLGNVAAEIELGGTRNPAAFDAYLRGSKAFYSAHHGAPDIKTAVAAYTQAIQLDPRYVLAYAGRSRALSDRAIHFATLQGARADYDKALADAQTAIALAPELADGYGALASVLQNGFLEFAQASENCERAAALAPGNAWTLSICGLYAVFMGHTDAGIAAARQATVLDPLNPHVRTHLLWALLSGHRYAEAVAVGTALVAFDPENSYAYSMRGRASYALGDFQSALASCAIKPDSPANQPCLAVTYRKLGRQADAEATLAAFQHSQRELGAYNYATIYAQWGDTPKALEWLETALKLRDSGLAQLKTDPLLDPLRNEPRFRAIEKALRFPD
jgi:TolB-like protein